MLTNNIIVHFSVLEMFQDDTLYKLTYLLTYLLDSYFNLTNKSNLTDSL